MTPDKRVFEKLEVVEGSSIQTAGGKSLPLKGKGPVNANGIKFGEVFVCVRLDQKPVFCRVNSI